MSTNYEPSAERVEALAKELHGAGRPAYGDWLLFPSMSEDWKAMMRAEARFVLRRQRERESGLLLAVAQLATLGGGHSDGNRIAQAALAAHAALDAPTLLEAAAAHVRAAANCCTGDAKTYAALKAAVEREESK